MSTQTPDRDTSAEPDPWPAGTPPEWWPRDHQNAPRRHCFRAMRHDLKDLVWSGGPSQRVDPASDEVRCLALQSVSRGSKQTSPFLHASWSVVGAQRYHSMACCRRKESPDNQVMVRLDLFAWYASRESPMRAHELIDLSTPDAQKAFFTKKWSEYAASKSIGDWTTDKVEAMAKSLKLSFRSEEVLIK